MSDTPLPPPPAPLDPTPSEPAGRDVGAGHIVDLQIERELQDSYLTYAMSTIMDRALPDVRDGLKPSQRRILVAMNDLRLYPGRKQLKCAKICGDTSGNYHPHGESVIYPTLVGMAQKWRMRVPLIDPQGNFGSIDGDPPAAMRYTEARLTHAAVDMLDDLGMQTVDFQPNYDERLEEPTVLPGKFPHLLINGGIGIAVGMATSLAPHNPIEVLDSIVRVLETPSISLLELMEDEKPAAIASGATSGAGAASTDPTSPTGAAVPVPTAIRRLGIKGPDFPTGGLILGRRGILEAYATGRGKVTVRGVVRTEDMGAPGGRQQLVIDTIPYSLVQTTLMERIVDAVKDERIKDISDVRNESGREAQSRIVIELKRGADPAVVENQLYEFTPLQQTFSIHNIALVNRQPRTLSLKEMIQYYIEHRANVIRRRTEHKLREALKRKHIVVGLIYAVCSIDEVIRIIRASRTRDEAILALMDRSYRIIAGSDVENMVGKDVALLAELTKLGSATGVKLTRVQAEAIGAMRLIQLVNMEVAKLVDELLDLQSKIRDYMDILARRERINLIIKADCDEMRARIIAGKNSHRLTLIQDAEGDIDIESLIQQDEVAVTISHHGYAKRSSLANYRQQGRGGKGIIAGTTKDDDFIEHMFVAGTHDDLLCFTDTGRVFKIKVYELPDLPRTSKGRPLVNLIELKTRGEATERRSDEGVAGENVGGSEAPAPAARGPMANRLETVRAFLAVKNFEQSSYYLTFVSKQGIVKRTALKDYRNVSKSGLIAVGLKEDDEVLDVTLTSGNDDILLATSGGMAIRFSEDDVRLMGRPAAGVKGIDLADGDEVIGVVAVPMAPDADGDLMTAPHAASICLLTITEKGYGKRTYIDEYRVQPEIGKARSQSRGGKGRADIDTSVRNGKAVAALGVHENDDVVVISRNGKLVRMPVAEIRLTGRGTQGVRVTKLDDTDVVVAAARVEEDTTATTPDSTTLPDSPAAPETSE